MKKAFNRVPKKMVEESLRIKGVPEVTVKTVMSLYEGATTKVRIGFVVSDKFSVKVRVHRDSVLSPLLFAMVMSGDAGCKGMVFYLCTQMIWY